MADLDDFFAKKDKKKSKKPKFLTAEELVKNLEETKREIAKAKKPEPATVPAVATVGDSEEKPKEQVSEKTNCSFILFLRQFKKLTKRII